VLSGKAVNERVVVRITARRSVVCGCSWNIQVRFLCLFCYSHFLYMCVCMHVYIYIYIYIYVYMRICNEEVFIVPCSALNLSACKCNIPVCRYKQAGRVSMSEIIPQELQQVTKS
jgi:hypothetical protein